MMKTQMQTANVAAEEIKETLHSFQEKEQEWEVMRENEYADGNAVLLVKVSDEPALREIAYWSSQLEEAEQVLLIKMLKKMVETNDKITEMETQFADIEFSEEEQEEILAFAEFVRAKRTEQKEE